MLVPSRPLPVCLPPQPDELLSSWIGRNAAFYDVPPLVLLQHAAPDIRSIPAADHHLTEPQADSLAAAFRTSSDIVLGMTFAKAPEATRPLISARPVQSCPTCAKPDSASRKVVTRGQLQGWRITCTLCGGWLDNLQRPDAVSTLERHAATAALVGQKFIDREAWSRKQFWMSPAIVARLLLARRVVRRPPRDCDYRRARILGLVIPTFDRIAACEDHDITKAGSLVVPLQLRPALLAGVAIVMRLGPEMLDKISSQTMGNTNTRLKALIIENSEHWTCAREQSQGQLI